MNHDHLQQLQSIVDRNGGCPRNTYNRSIRCAECVLHEICRNGLSNDNALAMAKKTLQLERFKEILV